MNESSCRCEGKQSGLEEIIPRRAGKRALGGIHMHRQSRYIWLNLGGLRPSKPPGVQTLVIHASAVK